ncbi:glutaminase [Nonlabens spongiae]|uniref:Glutaminase n=1 Tax=Nonlabens spongiae TaxID=331648 RepID=A0A1W6MHH4_9FLAO|nr:glutaminase [Nonlabens spongiae]ARN77030.1 glutaminase [Nonlabens spongiae]
MDSVEQLIKEIYDDIKSQENKGAVADYIPELAKVDPERFGVHYTSIEGNEFGIGDYQTKFSIQSIAKVLSLSLAYKYEGDAMWDRVGVEPSGNPYNSLVQLEDENGIPRNPLINAGAIVVCDILLSRFEHPLRELLDFIKSICDHEEVDYNLFVARSEKSIGYRNVALCNYLKSLDNLENEPEDVLDFYFTMCSLEMSCQNLSRAFLFLACDDFRNREGKQILPIMKANRVNAIMQTCGFYDESGEFSFRVGLPGKSGVGGGIIALHPEKYSIAVWSPRLNEKGNSYRGMRFLEEFTSRTNSHLF